MTHYTDKMKFPKRLIDDAEIEFLSRITGVQYAGVDESGILCYRKDVTYRDGERGYAIKKGKYHIPTDPLIKQAILFQESLTKAYRRYAQ